MRKLLIIDTETTGLPVSWEADVTDTNNWPRIIQLAWELCWENGETIKKVCELVIPDGWSVPSKELFLTKGLSDEEATKAAAFWVEHGYTQEENESWGLPMKQLLLEFMEAYNQADLMIAHNMGYDLPVIVCETIRYGVKAKKSVEKYCTKLNSELICKLPGLKGKYKWPTLDEAYRFMFGKPFLNAHDAGADVQACKEVYLWMQDHEKFGDFL